MADVVRHALKEMVEFLHQPPGTLDTLVVVVQMSPSSPIRTKPAVKVARAASRVCDACIATKRMGAPVATPHKQHARERGAFLSWPRLKVGERRRHRNFVLGPAIVATDRG